MRYFTIIAMLFFAGISVFAQEPVLPEGLESPKKEESRETSEPSLPAGLGGEEKLDESSEPSLPMGLEAEKKNGQSQPELPEGLFDTEERPPGILEDKSRGLRLEERLPFDLNGFWEARGGFRIQDDKYEKDVSAGEVRLQLEAERRLKLGTFRVTSDFIYDPVGDEHDIDLEEGEGWLDLRNAYLLTSPTDFMDLKFGRQILTWGTGNYIFINDLFPKDWVSFFIGRDDEYLKAPSDAVKTSFYTELANLDIVYTPRFDSDRYISGERISYWNSMLGRRAGEDAVIRADKPDEWFQDEELAVRLFKNVSGYELALYGYWGYWKSPAGTNPVTLNATFPELSVYGASVRGAVGKGIGNIEVGYYDSRDDRNGDDPFVRNSEIRFLVGYEEEIARNLTAGVQYYFEWMMDYSEFEKNLPKGMHANDEDRHVVTLHLRKLLMSQNLELSLFTFYSPTDQDAYFRPKVHYQIDDNWSAEVGGSIFLGEEDYTFFGQFENNSNIYTAARYGF